MKEREGERKKGRERERERRLEPPNRHFENDSLGKNKDFNSKAKEEKK